MRTSAQTRHYCGACRVWPQAPSSLASSLLPQQTYPTIHPCHTAALRGFGDDAIYSNNTPFHSQCTFKFINGFHLISQQTRGRQGRVLTYSLSTDKVLCVLWFPQATYPEMQTPGLLCPHQGTLICALSLLPSIHLLLCCSSLLPLLSISIAPIPPYFILHKDNTILIMSIGWNWEDISNFKFIFNSSGSFPMNPLSLGYIFMPGTLRNSVPIY